MKLRLQLFLPICFLWTMAAVVKMGKIPALHAKINGLKKGVTALNTKMDKIAALGLKVNGLRGGIATLNTKTDRMVAKMGTKINTISKGLTILNTKWDRITGMHTKINKLNKRITVLSTRMDKLAIKTEGRDCADICKKGVYPSGVYEINPSGKKKFKVYCDMKTAGGGWTVIQKRADGSMDFYRTWNEYKKGFGSLNNEFWLGNDKISLLTHIAGRTQALRVDLEDKKGNKRYALYRTVQVGSEAKKYKLTVGKYSGNAGDSLTYHSGAAFSTKDRGNKKCAIPYKGAWWYKTCHYSNLNGKYHNGKHKSFADGVNWYHWKGRYYSYPRAEMKIRPSGFSACMN